MFHIRHKQKQTLFTSVMLGVLFLISITLIATIAPSNVSAKSFSDMTADEKAKSYTYYIAFADCIEKNMRLNISGGPGQNGNIAPNKRDNIWFDGNKAFSNSQANTTVYPNGPIACEDLATPALALWGYGPNDYRQFLESVGCTYNTNSADMECSRSGTERRNNFQGTINTKVYGGQAPSIGKPGDYILYLHGLNIEKCQTSTPKLFSSANATEQQYARDSTVSDGKTYKIIKYVGADKKAAEYIISYAATDENGAENKATLYGRGIQDKTGVYQSCTWYADRVSDNADFYAAYAVSANITPPGAGNSEGADGEVKSTCNINGIGWLICPVLNVAASIVDGAYGFVSSLLKVQPLMSSVEGSEGIYKAWQIMRNFANVAFVIAFLVIIFSQLTSFGVSNYGIKKLLPKIVMAAILVNVSYWICAIVVDISNILGSSLNGLMDSLGASLTKPDGIEIDGTKTGEGWSGLTLSVLSVAAVGATLYVGVSALIPALIAVLVAIVTVFLVLTLRQALIIILIVIAPLAFVALLLPNTESLFKKWRALFQTLLLMYPIIALIFGASALASTVIMHSADNIAVQIMGAAVAIIPLAITPVVMKTAGGLLNRFGGVVNNPNKGPFDRMKRTGEGIRERQKVKRGLRAMDGDKFSMPGRRATARYFSNRDRSAKARASQYDNQQQSQWLNSNGGAKANVALSQSEVQAEVDKNLSTLRVKSALPVDLQIKAKATGDAVKATEDDLSQLYEEVKVKSPDTGAPKHALYGQVSADTLQLAQEAKLQSDIANDATNSAKRAQQLEYADAIESSPSRAARAGGIDPYGAQRAVAQATSIQHKVFDDAVEDEKKTMSSSQPIELDSIMRDTTASVERRAAAAAKLVQNGGAQDVMNAIDYIGSQPANPQGSDAEKAMSAIQQQVAGDIGARKPAAIGAGAMSNMKAGRFSGTMNSMVAGRIDAGKFSAEGMTSMPKEELDHMITYINANKASLDYGERIALSDSITAYRSNPQFKQPNNEVAKRMDAISSILL